MIRIRADDEIILMAGELLLGERVGFRQNGPWQVASLHRAHGSLTPIIGDSSGSRWPLGGAEGL